MPPLSGVEKLAEQHVLAKFECGKPSLDDWLKRYALANQKLDSSQTYVVHRNSVVVGYYSLTAGSVRKQEAPARVGKGMPNYPLGVILLARLAVDRRERGTGLGGALMKDALTRCLSAADTIGARAVLVHALDEEARSFYEHFDFERCPGNDLHLMLRIQDLRASVSA
ncbi:MAG: GNAT family N-acetyltransferase [Acidobacteriia bacterium]|nr:GNAT family N-acetyltransferase [Terriglobia bacterium]